MHCLQNPVFAQNRICSDVWALGKDYRDTQTRLVCVRAFSWLRFVKGSEYVTWFRYVRLADAKVRKTSQPSACKAALSPTKMPNRKMKLSSCMKNHLLDRWHEEKQFNFDPRRKGPFNINI